MMPLEIVFIAIALSIDAFAVSLAAAAAGRVTDARAGFRLAFHFGFFQFAMPILGWAAGATLAPVIAPIDHWVAAAFLAVVALRMLRPPATDEGLAPDRDPTRGVFLVTLATATSIDALAVGLSLAMLGVNILAPSVVIGVVTTTVSTLAILLGARLHLRFGRAAEQFGGVVLLLIALRILADHLLFGGG
jgi:manganese efflux pump family protein